MIGKIEVTDVYHFPISYDGHLLPYDWQTNTLYIPQSIKNDAFTGELQSEYGTLIFADCVEITDYPKLYTDDFNDIVRMTMSTDEDGNEEEVAEVDASELPEKTYRIGEVDKITSVSNNGLYKLYLIWDDSFAWYNVIFTGMPTISLTYDSYDSENMSWTGNMEMIDPYHKGKEYYEGSCTFHLRGDSTSHLNKKSYTLKLDEKERILGLREDDDWALVAELGDNGYVHNKLAYDLWNDISATNNTAVDETVDSEFVEVFYDNTYAGVYNLCERIDKKQCNLKQEDYLYRLDETMFEIDTDPSMIEQHIYQIKWPKEFTDADYYIINRFENTFYSKEDIDYENAKSLLNMDNVIDMNLYSMLICGVDNWGSNCYYIATKRDDYKISEVMWDMNESFGDNEWFNFTEEYITSEDMMIPYVERLYDANPKEMSEALYNRWKELRKDVIKKKKLNDRVDDMKSYLYDSGALTRESSKWARYLKLDWRYENLNRFIDERIDFLDNYYEAEYNKYH